MDTILQDLRFAARTLRRNLGFTAAAVLTLALGIGANSAIFSVVNAVLLRPLPYADADRLAMVWGWYDGFGKTSTSLPDFRDLRERTRAFSQLAALHGTVFNLTGRGEPEQLSADRVTANFFPLLGVRPMLGRGFLPEEEQVGGNDDVVVLSHGLWQRRFGGDPGILGRTLQLSGRPYTVVGVAPPEFRFMRDVDLWAPVRADTVANRRGEYLLVFGRLAPGATVERASADIAGIFAQLAREYPETNGSIKSRVIGMREDFVGDVRPALLVFSGAVALVLLIACANVANLLLARASVREREMAVRAAIGAGRGRIVRQLLTESLLIALLGAGLGLGLAALGLDALRAMSTELLPRFQEVRVDAVAVVFALVLAVATGLLFGIAPALRLSAGALGSALREGSRGAVGGAALRLRNALVLAEVALALMLLVGAGLLVRSFQQLNRVDLGFDPTHLLTYRVVLPTAKYDSVALLPPVYQEIAERTRAIPGVVTASVTGDMPINGAGYITFTVEGRVPPPDAMEDLQPFSVSPEHFAVFRIPLRRGRLFTAGDAPGAPPVAIVNEEMVRRYFDGRDPIGKRVTFGDPADSSAVWWTVVGVVGNVAQEGVTARPYAQLYRPLAQAPRRGIYVVARTTGDPMGIAPAAREALEAVDPELPLTSLMMMEERIGENLLRPRVNTLLLAVFAGIALALAAIGIYGVISYAVAQRTREIGIRMALGATAGDVRRLVVRQGMTPALLGVALGAVGALAATRLMASLLYGVTATDPLTFGLVALFLGGIALLASYVPARRATRLEPVTALREE
ncbi:MAG TPA: ABC transporter permease [Gemmatimonadaceae bacterium]|nr:ABC transporter permease [Gemmatimonadaceae bacterium]